MPTTMQGQPTTGFLGVNLRKDRLSLADSDVARAINADLHLQPGTIVLRLGRTRQDLSALTDLIIRRIARVNGHRYRVAGQSLYCGTAVVLNGLLSSTLLTTLTPYRPLNDSTIWTFVADHAVMKKVDCTTVQAWGLAALGTIVIAGGYGSSGLTGTYNGRATEVRHDGTAIAHEGNAAVAPTAVTLSTQDFTYGDLVSTNTDGDGFGLYRTATGGSTYLLDTYTTVPSTSASTVVQPWEATVSPSTLLFHPFRLMGTASQGRRTQAWESTTDYTGSAVDAAGKVGTYLWEISLGYVTTQTKGWAYASTTADASLGNELEEDNNPPPTAAYGFLFQEHIFLTQDVSNPSYLSWSKRYRPESFPTDNFLDIGTADDPLQGGLSMAGMAGVFSRRTKYRLVGNDTSGFVHQEALSRRGTPAPMAIAATEFGAAFVARDGVFLTNFVDKDTELTNDLEPLFFGQTVNDFAPINWDAASLMSACTYKGRYYWAYASQKATLPDMVAVYSSDTGKWYFYDHPLSSLYYEEDTDLLVGGGQTGYVYILETGTSDQGAAIALEVQTKDFAGDNKDVRKLFLWTKFDADTQGQDVTVQLYLDDALRATQTLNTSTRTDVLLPLPEGCMGFKWRIKVTYTGTTRIRVYGAAALYAPMVVA